MKKIIVTFGAAILMVAGISSCNNGGSSANGEYKQLGDSVATSLGHVAAAQAAQQYQSMKEMRPEMAEKFSKEAYLKGIKAVLDADTTQIAYFQGLQMGLQLVNPVIGINNEAKVPVDKSKVLEAFKEIYMADSIGDNSQYFGEYQALMTRVQTIMKERHDAEVAASPEAQKNLSDGKAYAEKMVKEGYTKAPSGIVYKIENPGTEPKVQLTDRVAVLYTGKSIEGEVFDTNKDNVHPMRVSGFVPGFKEALTMLGKGGKMTVVIPADLAYGLDGSGDKIGPNQTLVFDIEIQEINPEK